MIPFFIVRKKILRYSIEFCPITTATEPEQRNNAIKKSSPTPMSILNSLFVQTVFSVEVFVSKVLVHRHRFKVFFNIVLKVYIFW